MGHGLPDYSLQLADESAALDRLIATELAGESLELPSFPEVALRVRKALGHADIPIEEVVRMVSAEPSLAVRLLQLANSAALNPGANRITTLRMAIARIGFNLARSATIAFAMSQMRRAEAWRGLERRFRELWDASAQLAAVAHALAVRLDRRVPGIAPDQALLAGMLTSVGRLFVLTRLSRFPLLLDTPEQYFAAQGRWQARVASAVLSHWDMSPEIVAAASGFESAGERSGGSGDLADVLFVARGLVLGEGGGRGTSLARLGLDDRECEEVVRGAGEEIASLRAALVD